MQAPGRPDAVISRLAVSAYTVPTDAPEADGTLAWNSTTLVLVQLHAEGQSGLGYSYTDSSAAVLIERVLATVILGGDAMAIPALWLAMHQRARNIGESGIAAHAISAIDAALWDLKARLLGVPLVTLLGLARDSIAVYGSGGFTSYSIHQLQQQLATWAEAGISCVKMKVGTQPGADVERVKAARDAIGPNAVLFVDANGAYSRKQSLELAEQFRDFGVVWFEEPVPSHDLAGLRLIRDRAPAGMDIAAGEYGYDARYFRAMLDAGAVDVLQADATRCSGITGFCAAATLAATYAVPLSAHTAPSLHVHPCCALQPVRHVEYFHDHVRIEHMFFDGAATAIDGMIRPNLAQSGLGLEFRASAAQPYCIYEGRT